MLAPKRQKYRKYQKGTLKNISHNLNHIKFGVFGLKCLESSVISAKTIEAVRRTLRRQVRRGGSLWTRMFPDLIVTRKPTEVRMGKGKGSPSFWVCKLRKGQIIYEMAGISAKRAEKAAKVAHSKLPFHTQLIYRS